MAQEQAKKLTFEDVVDTHFRDQFPVTKLGTLDVQTTLGVLEFLNKVDFGPFGRSKIGRLSAGIFAEKGRFIKEGGKMAQTLSTEFRTPLSNKDIATVVGRFGTQDYNNWSAIALSAGLNHYLTTNISLGKKLFKDIQFSNLFRVYLSYPIMELHVLKAIFEGMDEGLLSRIRFGSFQTRVEKIADVKKWEKIMETDIPKEGDISDQLVKAFDHGRKKAVGSITSSQAHLSRVLRWAQMMYDDDISVDTAGRNTAWLFGKESRPWLKQGALLLSKIKTVVKAAPVLSDTEFIKLFKLIGVKGSPVNSASVQSLISQKLAEAVDAKTPLDDLIRNDGVFTTALRLQFAIIASKATAIEFLMGVFKESGAMTHLRTGRMVDKEITDTLRAQYWREQ